MGSGIYTFYDENFYLSNYYAAPVTYEGITYKSSEAAFQAQKTLQNELRMQFAALSPDDAKKLGKRVVLREDWEAVKIHLMYEIVKAKFTQNAELGKKLCSTDNVPLAEGNSWHDVFWGVDEKTGKGENNLGKILMKVRDELRNEI